MASKITRLSSLGLFLSRIHKNMIWEKPQPQHPVFIQQLSVRECRLPVVLVRNAHLMAWSTDSEDAKVWLDTPSPMDNVMNDQLALNLVDICLDNMKVLCKSLLCLA